MLTAKGKYALKALIYLSTLEPGEKAQGLAISKAGNIPKKVLDAILAELRDATCRSRRQPELGCPGYCRISSCFSRRQIADALIETS